MAGLTHRDVWRAKNVEAETSVYWAYASDSALLYVGMARDVDDRLSQHRREKPWWEAQVVIVRSLRFPDRATAAVAERRAIAAGQPSMNLDLPGHRRRP